MNKTRKTVALVALIVVIICTTIAGTVAYLQAKTTTVTNTFTPTTVGVTLAETTGTNYQMVPGVELAKDPKVTVSASEVGCYVFVKLEKSDNFDTFMNCAIAQGWTKLTDDVYYREVACEETTRTFSVLDDDKVSVYNTVTNEMMSQLNANPTFNPTLKVTAYVIQMPGFTSAATAWAQVTQ